ncbi:MAG: radical SAM protein [Myxococcales bacterium]|nr:radical SAM protein [Myxococcales bacterium]
MPTSLRDTIQRRLSRERGTIFKSAPLRVALTYPSPYSVAMSSLGFQTMYRELNGRDDTVAERAFYPDDVEEHRRARETLVTYEGQRPLGDYPVIALSVAYENELAGVIETLELGGIPALSSERSSKHHPFVLMGGPLTFSNPTPLAPFADAVVMGEGEDVIHAVIEALVAHDTHEARLDALATHPNVWVPSRHGESLATIAKSDKLPAFSQIITPETELADMFLVESERGCSRGCTYCVMRRSTNGGMRLAPEAEILSLVPEGARKVGLVGAAVSDHPRIVDIVNALADRGLGVGLSSLRPDRLTDPFVAALKRGGYRTLTTAMDGPSARLRTMLERRAKVEHLERCAELARAHAMQTLKLYLMIGLPSETDEDIDECVAFVSELSKRAPIALGIAPFVSKRNTPLDKHPWAGIKIVEDRLERLRKGLKGRADVRPTSARWAWVEYVLAQGGANEGRAVYDAVKKGGRFADYARAFEAIGVSEGGRKPRRALSVVSQG